MKNIQIKKAINDFASHLWDSITWGKLVYIVVLFGTSFLIYKLVKN